MKRVRITPDLLRLPVAAISALLIVISYVAGVVSGRTVFFCLTLLLLTYNVLEFTQVRRNFPRSWLLHPLVLASFLTFCLPFGICNVLFTLPDQTLSLVDIDSHVSTSMVKIMWLVLLGSVSLWIGYRLPVFKMLTSAKACRRATRWLRNRDAPRAMAVPALGVVALGARLMQVHLGVYGYSANPDRLLLMSDVTQYLSMAASLGPVALTVASLSFFDATECKRPTVKFWFFLVLAIEVTFGVLSGFKSQVAIPFIVAGVCKYVRAGRIPVVWIVGFFAALVMAYAIIEPFREYKNTDRAFSGTTLTGITDAFEASRETAQSSSSTGTAPVWLHVLTRSSKTYVGSLGIAYRDDHDWLPEGSPAFLRNLLLAPLYAVIPRILMPDKPTGTLGAWYTSAVVGQYWSMSSTAMSPVTYLYFAGGITAVASGFAFFGGLLRLLYFWTQPHDVASRIFVYLVLLPQMTQIDSAVDGMLVGLIRTIPLLLVLNYFVYKRSTIPRTSGATPVGANIDQATFSRGSGP